MRLSNRVLIFALSAVAVSASFRALSDSSSEAGRLVDANAFDAAWTGEYYNEPAETEGRTFENFEAKRRYYLESPEVGVEEDAADGGEAEAEVAPTPTPRPFLYPWLNPFLTYGDKAPAFPWSKASPVPAPIPSVVAPRVPPKPQAMYYYDRGSLKNASELEPDGRGFVKVFRDRDAEIGGRAWGTRTMIDLIRKVASEFADKYPGYERLQIGDIARKVGGKTKHGSHQNGLDADIVFVRKNHKEQLAFGGYGKNGFAEQFVIRTAATRAYRDTKGKWQSPKPVMIASANFDVEANFHLLLMFNESAKVKVIFMDKVLVREMFRYAERNKIDDNPAVVDLLKKLVHSPFHTDHFHLRLLCQESDTKCVSSIAAAHARPRPPVKKTPVSKKTTPVAKAK